MPKRDLIIAIAYRGDPMGLWVAINSIEFELKKTKLNWAFSIFSNGEKLHTDAKQTLLMLRNNTKYLDYWEHSEESFTPQMARTKAIENSDSEFIFCCDSHVLVCPDFFLRLMHDWEKTDADVLHSCTQYYSEDIICYGYKLQLKSDFWGTSETIVRNEYKPFKVAAAGHGGVGFKRSSYNKYGGYYLSSSFVGYAGEELTYDLGVWLQGGTVWISPQALHRHWASITRGYARHHSEDFYRNLFSCAFILADETAENYVYKMSDHFKKFSRPFMKSRMFDLISEARMRSKPAREWLRNKRLRPLEEQLKYFDENEIAYK